MQKRLPTEIFSEAISFCYVLLVFIILYLSGNFLQNQKENDIISVLHLFTDDALFIISAMDSSICFDYSR